jgi:hypothetical protein
VRVRALVATSCRRRALDVRTTRVLLVIRRRLVGPAARAAPGRPAGPGEAPRHPARATGSPPLSHSPSGKPIRRYTPSLLRRTAVAPPPELSPPLFSLELLAPPLIQRCPVNLPSILHCTVNPPALRHCARNG